MRFVDRAEIFERLIKSESTSNIWVLNLDDVKGTRGQLIDGRGYLICKHINDGTTLGNIKESRTIFIEFEENEKPPTTKEG